MVPSSAKRSAGRRPCHKDVPRIRWSIIIFSKSGLDMRKNGNVILIAPGMNSPLGRNWSTKRGSRSRSGAGAYRNLPDQLSQAETIFCAQDKSQTMLSKRVRVVMDSRSNKLFITDIPSRLDDVRRMLTEIDIPSRQVLIEARIVEASDAFAKNLGFVSGIYPVSRRQSTHSQQQPGDRRRRTETHFDNRGRAHQRNAGLPQSANGQSSGHNPIRNGRRMSFILYNSARTQFSQSGNFCARGGWSGQVISSPQGDDSESGRSAGRSRALKFPNKRPVPARPASRSKKANLALKG